MTDEIKPVAPAGASDPPIDGGVEVPSTDVDELIRRSETLLDDVEKRTLTVDDELRKQVAEDRSKIAKIVVWVFALAVGVTVLFVIISALVNLVAGWLVQDCSLGGVLAGSCGPGSQWMDAGTFLLDFLTSLVLPVVTLVIGFYFGTQKTEK